MIQKANQTERQTDGLIIKEWRNPSATGIGEVQVKMIVPSDQPRLILQITHGMAEHMERYDLFARYLASQNILVICSDHPGHGRSAPDEKHLGFFAEKEGWQKALKDLHNITEQVREQYPTLPIVLFGHSMGSFFARTYSAAYGSELRAAIYSGTAGGNPVLPVARFLAARSVRRNGPYYRDPFLAKLMSRGFLDRILSPASKNAWLTRDHDIVSAYDADPLCGFAFTAAGYRDLFDLLKAIQGPKWARRVPTNLPIWLFSGADDPVGGFGIGVESVHKLLVSTGHANVKVTLYPEGRHEMLNEINKMDVFADVLVYLESLLAIGGQK
jgi:alpha-beta hydrolase superfamily lysophospholipase